MVEDMRSFASEEFHGRGCSKTTCAEEYLCPPCPLGVTHPGHYWQDGSCRCDDHIHHEVMGQLGWKTFDASKLPPRKKFYPRLGPLDCITSTVPS